MQKIIQSSLTKRVFPFIFGSFYHKPQLYLEIIPYFPFNNMVVQIITGNVIISFLHLLIQISLAKRFQYYLSLGLGNYHKTSSILFGDTVISYFAFNNMVVKMFTGNVILSLLWLLTYIRI